MGCLDNLIGIKSSCDEAVTGSSGLYIEDLGITCSEADSYINSEYSSGQELIVDKIALATRLIKSNIANHLGSSFNSSSLIASNTLGEYQDSLNLKSGITDKMGGISLTLLNSNSYYNVFVNSISLQVDVTEDIDVKCYDLISGELLDTFTVSCVANKISSLVVNKVYGSYKRKLDLIFVYDTTDINSNTTYLSTTGCTQCNGYRYSNYYISSTPVYIGSSDTKIRSLLVNNSHTFGLSINYSIQCSLDNWLCEIANLMALPILYKAGVEIMNYATMYSNRQTSSINIDAERNKERLAAYEKCFAQAIDATLKKMILPEYDKCFSCNNSTVSKIILP